MLFARCHSASALQRTGAWACRDNCTFRAGSGTTERAHKPQDPGDSGRSLRRDSETNGDRGRRLSACHALRHGLDLNVEDPRTRTGGHSEVPGARCRRGPVDLLLPSSLMSMWPGLALARPGKVELGHAPPAFREVDPPLLHASWPADHGRFRRAAQGSRGPRCGRPVRRSRVTTGSSTMAQAATPNASVAVSASRASRSRVIGASSGLERRGVRSQCRAAGSVGPP